MKRRWDNDLTLERFARSGARFAEETKLHRGAAEADAAFELAMTLQTAARLAARGRVTERTFLDLARTLFRQSGGAPAREGRPTSRDGWTDLVEAYGGVARLAGELEVDRRTLARWRSGATEVPADKQRGLTRLARSAKVGWRL